MRRPNIGLEREPIQSVGSSPEAKREENDIELRKPELESPPDDSRSRGFLIVLFDPYQEDLVAGLAAKIGHGFGDVIDAVNVL